MTRPMASPIRRWTRTSLLLSDTVAKADNATIANPHIDSVKTVEGVAKVNVTYSLNGKNVNDSLTINKDGSKFLLFPN